MEGNISAIPLNFLSGECSHNTLGAWSFYLCLDNSRDSETTRFLEKLLRLIVSLLPHMKIWLFHDFGPVLIAWLLEQCPRNLKFLHMTAFQTKESCGFLVRNAFLRTFHIQNWWKLWLINDGDYSSLLAKAVLPCSNKERTIH